MPSCYSSFTKINSISFYTLTSSLSDTIYGPKAAEKLNLFFKLGAANLELTRHTGINTEAFITNQMREFDYMKMKDERVPDVSVEIPIDQLKTFDQIAATSRLPKNKIMNLNPTVPRNIYDQGLNQLTNLAVSFISLLKEMATKDL